MKKAVIFGLALAAVALAGAWLAACGSAGVQIPIEPVTGITGVPEDGVVGAPLTLSGTVEPANATNKTITWSVKNAGGTGITTIPSNRTITAAAAGTLVVTATIANGLALGVPYTEDFTIIFEDAPPEFVPVEDIIFTATIGFVGEPLALNGTEDDPVTVVPSNATSQDIVWSIKDAGTTGITEIDEGDTVTAVLEGTLVVTATIAGGAEDGEDYTQDFTIEFIEDGEDVFIAVQNITINPQAGTVKVPFTLTPSVIPDVATNKDIVWSVKDAGGTGITTIPSDRTITATAAGTLVVTATIARGTSSAIDYTKDFSIVFSIIPVTKLEVWATSGYVGTSLELTYTITPETATFQDIVWTVKDAGTTGIKTIPADNKVTATAAGTLVVTATIAGGTATGNFTQDYSIVFRPPYNKADFTGYVDMIGTNGPWTATMVDEFEYGEGYGLTISAAGRRLSSNNTSTWTHLFPTTHRITKDNEYLLEIEFTASRDFEQELAVVLVDTNADAKEEYWAELSDYFTYELDADGKPIQQDQTVSVTIHLVATDTAGRAVPNSWPSNGNSINDNNGVLANCISFSTVGEGIPETANSGVKGPINLTFTKFKLYSHKNNVSNGSWPNN